MPTDTPQMKIWDSAGSRVTAKDMPLLDRITQVGLFHYPLYLGSGYSAGQYRVTYYATVGSYEYLGEDGFEIIAGGHQDGAVVGMYFYFRPHANFIVEQLASGKIIKGRNPII